MTLSPLREKSESHGDPARAELRCSDFDFDLPPHLIAQTPLPGRSQSRLLCLDGASGERRDRDFVDLPEFISPRDLLVFNDTRVFPARILGRKASGGRIELLVERILGQPGRLLTQIRASKPPRPGTYLTLDGGVRAEVTGRDGDFFLINVLDARPTLEVLEEIGRIPLPPYIERPATGDDRERYQTVYARETGAVAAPTAGLHFDEAMMARLSADGIETAFVTLHVGAGTFQPIRGESLADHRMHSEYVRVGRETCERIARTRAKGGRVIAVGTTVVRALESAGRGGRLRPYEGETDIFIRPGHRFLSIDALVTNFHMPRSTLLMLVCAFAGTERVLAAYRHAVAEGYRFFSYGDAMFLSRAGVGLAVAGITPSPSMPEPG